MLAPQELIEDIQAEIGECSSASVDLTGHLTNAECCETLEDLKQNILDAKGVCLLIMSNLNDQLSRLSQGI